jgi:hypothetical protein
MIAEHLSAGRIHRLLLATAIAGPLSGAVALLPAPAGAEGNRAPARSLAHEPTATASRRTHARAARVLSINDTGHLNLLHASGAVLLEQGPSSGTLPGTVKVHMVVAADVQATFTITSSAGGSIEGHGVATLHSSGRYSSFAGTLSVSHGTGRFAHAHGTGRLYGVINRRTDALTVQTIGNLNY